MRILVVEDFAPLREAVTQGLKEAGYAVDVADNGQDALRYARGNEHDVIVLDLMLPKLDGLSVLKTLRSAQCPANILILTAKDTPQDRINGLDLGADDYLVKPFVFAEFMARVRALVRRKYEAKSSLLQIGNLQIDLARRQVRRGGEMIDLSGREYALLEFLALNTNRIVSRNDIWQHLYDFNASMESNVVDVFVGLLRKKIERPGQPRLLHTRRGQGYMLAALAEEER
ncbi:MAG TPA: response regulator transcription factor [Humisphaera sp.]|nr:response regulator transcription factor [Humisphaera sp.]